MICATARAGCIKQLESAGSARPEEKETLKHMAMDGEAANDEAKIKKQFEKLTYSVTRLDRNNDNRRPDFLISDSSDRPLMLCEVKTINSAGGGVSMQNPNLEDFKITADRIQKQIDDRIEDAADQRAKLIKEFPQYEQLPFLVALILGFLVDLVVYPRRFNKDVSGILTIERDVALGKAFDELSEAEKERRLRTNDARGLPPNSKHFRLVRNKAAHRKVPKDFQSQCIIEGYNESL